MAGTKAPRRKSLKSKAPAKSKSNGAAQVTNSAPIEFDDERLASVKEAEGMVEDSRLAHDEAKAKYGLSRAEHKLFVARRNRIIAKTEKPKDVENAQREVDNARGRMVKARSLAEAARDEWKGAEERLAKALTERLPLFDGNGKSGSTAA